jgi:hypothetical protein
MTPPQPRRLNAIRNRDPFAIRNSAERDLGDAASCQNGKNGGGLRQMIQRPSSAWGVLRVNKRYGGVPAIGYGGDESSP